MATGSEDQRARAREHGPDAVEGEVEGKARPGRRKTGWIDNVESWTEGGVAAAREKAHKRMPTVP